MIFNTTHTNEEYNELSQSLVGKAYGLLQKIKLGGIGSGRLMIADISPKIKPKQVQFSEINYGNIEMRPKGIIVHFTNRLERFSWVVPYYQLAIYNSSFFSIHANGHFLKFQKNKNYVDNKRFIDKMIDTKNEFLNLDYYDG